MLTFLLLFAGFFLLIKGADLLVNGASVIAKALHVSDMVIGLTIVAFGTSMPEMVVSVFSGMKGNADLAIGNILGSNIANILLILGVSAIVGALSIQENTLISEIPFSLTAALLLGFLANAALLVDSPELMLSRIDGGILLFFFVLFMLYIYRLTLQGSANATGSEASTHVPFGKALGSVVAGIVILFFGGKWVVDGAVSIATIFGISESLIGLTIVAVGTSLPELVTSVVAAYRKNVDISVGNVIGSNIFNILCILGISSLINPLPFAVLSNTDILAVIASSSALILALVIGKKYVITRWKGLIFISMYAAYIAYLIQRG